MVAALQKIVNLISPDWYLRPADSGFFILNAMKKLIFIFALVFVSCKKQTETFCTDARYTEHGFLFQYNDHYNGFVDHESDNLDIGRIYIVQYEKCGTSVCIVSYTPAKYSNGGGIINPC